MNIKAQARFFKTMQKSVNSLGKMEADLVKATTTTTKKNLQSIDNMIMKK